MTSVVEFPGITSLDMPPERILRKAKDADLQSVVVIGFTRDGAEYFGSSLADGADVVWMLERAKLRLLLVPDEIAAHDS